MTDAYTEVTARLGIVSDVSQVGAWTGALNQAAAASEVAAARIARSQAQIAASSQLAFTSQTPGFTNVPALSAAAVQLGRIRSEMERIAAIPAIQQIAAAPLGGRPGYAVDTAGTAQYARTGLLPPPQMAISGRPPQFALPAGVTPQLALPPGGIQFALPPGPSGIPQLALPPGGQIPANLLSQYSGAGAQQGGRYLFTGSGSGFLPPGGVPPPPINYGGFGAAAGGGGPSGPSRDYFGEFKTGFFGTSGRSLVEQAGQAAKFSVLYGTAYAALFAFSQGIQTAVESAVNFNNALAELTIATGGTAQENLSFAQRLGQEATAFGLAPEAGVTAGARAIGLYDLRDEPQAIREQAAIQSTRVTSGLSFITGSAPEDIQKDVGAIAGAFDLAASSVEQIADLDAYFTRQFGVETGSTLETGAQIGTLGREAGFTIEEVIALSAQVQARTGQTPAAVAGLLSQFFGRAGDPAMREQFAQLGIDVSQPFRDQIQELSALDIGPELKNQIINAFGRGRAGGAAATIIETFPEVTEEVARAETEAPGTAAAQLEQRMSNFGGQLATLGGNFRELFVAIGNSGLLDILGLLVVALNALLESVQPLFNFLASLNGDPFLRAIRDAVIALGIFSLALKTSAGQAAASKIVDALAVRGGISRIGPGGIASALGPYGRAPLAPSGVAATTAAARGGVAAAAGRGALAVGTGFITGTAGAATGVALLALAAIDAANSLKGITDAEKNIEAAGKAAAQAFEEPTAAGLEAEADNLRSNVEEMKRAAEEPFRVAGLAVPPALLGPLAGLTGLDRPAGFSVADERGIALGEEMATFYDEAAQRQRALEVQTDTADTSIFGDPATATIEGINSTLETLTIKGVTAERRMQLLADAFLKVGEGADNVRAKSAVLPIAADKIAAGLGEDEGLFTGVGPGRAFTEAENINAAAQGRTAQDLYGIQFDNIINENLTTVQTAIDENLPKRIGPDGLTPQQSSRLADAVIAAVPDLEKLGEDGRRVLINALNEIIGRGGVTQALKGDEKIPGNLAKGLATTLEVQFQEAQAALLPGDSLGQLRLLKSHYENLEQLAARTEVGPALRAIQAQKEQALGAFVDAQLADSARMREAAQSNAKSLAEVRRIGQRFARRDLRTAVRGGSIDTIISVMNGVNRQAINAVIAELRAALRVAQAAADAAANLVSGISSAATRFAPEIGAAFAAADRKASEAEAIQQQIATAIQARGRAVSPRGNQGAYYQDPLGRFGDEADAAEETETAAQIAAAAAAARAARTNDAVAQARAQVQAASADLAAAEPGTVEYYSALQQYYEAQRALTEAITSTSNARIMAQAANRGSPLVVATATLKTARATLAQETPGTLAYFEALQAFYEAQAGLSQAMRDFKYTQAQLRGDVTDPVDQARADLQNARRQLRYDQRNNSGPDAVAAARLEVRSQQANLQQTKFDQWLTDLQNQEQLEQIGHAQYLRTLERRIQHLKEIKNRTRQQDEQLVQLQLILQEAQKALAAQFNIGEIRVPTPYEARRFIEEQQLARERENGGAAGATAGAAGAAVNSNNTTTVTIDGADTGEVRRILNDILGRQAISSRSTATSKR